MANNSMRATALGAGFLAIGAVAEAPEAKAGVITLSELANSATAYNIGGPIVVSDGTRNFVLTTIPGNGINDFYVAGTAEATNANAPGTEIGSSSGFRIIRLAAQDGLSFNIKTVDMSDAFNFGQDITVNFTDGATSITRHTDATPGLQTEVLNYNNILHLDITSSETSGLSGATALYVNFVTDAAAAIPEPAGLAVLGGGLAGLLAARRRRVATAAPAA